MPRCRVVRGMRGPGGHDRGQADQFNTVRYQRELLEQSGSASRHWISRKSFGRIARIADTDDDVVTKCEAIEQYADASAIPKRADQDAKLGVVVDRWTAGTAGRHGDPVLDLDRGIFRRDPCTHEHGQRQPDPLGLRNGLAGVRHAALVLASGKPSALVDWNNNYGDDPDKGVVFHCSNLPKTIFVDEIPRMDYQAIIAGTVGRDNTYGTIVGRVRENPFSYLRISTDDPREDPRLCW